MAADSDNEWLRMENEHQRRKADDDFRREMARKEQRRETLVSVLVALVVIAVVSGIASIVVYAMRVNSQPNMYEIECIKAGGTWTSIDQGSDACWFFTGGREEK